MNYRMIFYALGWVVRIEAVCLLLPFVCGLCYSEPSAWVFLMISALCFILSIPMALKKPKNSNMFAKEGFVIVALSWIVMSILGALPFVISGAIPNYIDAVFETASGFTTTGASILTDVEVLSKCILFWRSFTHWIGGMGVIVFLVAILSLSGGNDFYLVKAESPGHSVSKLVPKVKTTATILYSIYMGMTIIEIVLLLFGGLDLFSALTLSFGTAGTGGFAILNSGIASYSSYVQIVITVFMILFGIDFSFYYLILMRKWKDTLKMEEVRAYLIVIFVATTLITLSIMGQFASVGESIRTSAFQVATAITTTGYSTADFNLWPQFAKTILVLLMFSGACSGSTGGGIKVSRFLILFKSVIKEIRVLSHPKSTIKVRLNGKVVDHEVLRGVNTFFGAYLLIYGVIMLVLSLDGFSFTTNFTAAVATLCNIGPGLEMIGPMGNYSAFSAISKIVLTLAMLIGRLEIFPMLILFSRRTWKR